MERLSYEEYQKLGGKCSMSDFPLLLMDCQVLLEEFTFGRIKDVQLTPRIQRCIVRIIDELQKNEEFDSRVISYSDGIESISYNADQCTEESKKDKCYKLCLQYLPNDLLYRGAK